MRDLASRSYYPALDGMRGMAILLVVIYHNFNFINYTFFGWLGVDLFFVLSGFLITQILLQTFNSKNYLSIFYIKRALRIFPLYYAALIVFLLILPTTLKDTSIIDYYTSNQLWLWVFLQNWLYIFKQPSGFGLLNHFWSLAVEEQFYLLWPILVLLIKKPKHLLIFIAFILILVIALRLYVWIERIENLHYYNLYTFSRIDGICIGCMVALVQKINKQFLSKSDTWIVLIFALLNFLFYFINKFSRFSFPFLAMIGYTTFAMIFGLLVNIGTTESSHWITRIFNNCFLRFFGKISFGLYVIHWPVYILMREKVSTWMNIYSPLNAEIIISTLLTMIAIILSLISYYTFEKRFLSIKQVFSNKMSNPN
jgi:peptidoglycan/LPS O-acetylase OafA/YrhL